MADYQVAVDALARQMMELQIMDTSRNCNTTPMPSLKHSHQFDSLATKVAKCTATSCHERNKELISFFGCPPIVMAKVWELVNEYQTAPKNAKTRHLLWGMHCLKEHPGFAPMTETMSMPDEERKPDNKTLRKWTWIMMEAIADLEDVVILWGNRKKNDAGSSCLIGVDCKDFRFQQILIPDPTRPGKMMINQSLNSFKLKGPGLRYEIATCLMSSDTVWISGPHLPGDMNDTMIFREGLKHKLEEEGERAEADDGCIGEAPDFIVCPMSMEAMGNEEASACNRRAQGRIEVMNRHTTHWKCPGKGNFVNEGTSEEKVEKHRLMFTASIVVKQTGMNLGVGELWKPGDDCKMWLKSLIFNEFS